MTITCTSTPCQMRRVIINPYGRTGNNMMEYMLALYIKSKIPNLRIYCDSCQLLGIFGIKFETEPLESKNDLCETIVINNSKIKIDSIIQSIKYKNNVKIVISYNLFDKYCYSTMIHTFRSIYGNRIDIPGYDEKYLVINIRLEDIATQNHVIHPNYPVIPFSFHRYILQKTGLKPVFLGQLDDGLISTQLRKTFKDAIFVPSRGIIQDFECLRRSKNLSIAVSTFSFLTAFLSDKNTNVYVPLYGLYNHRDRPDLDYIVNDPRFHYYEFPQINWKFTDQQIQNIISNNNREYKEIKT